LPVAYFLLFLSESLLPALLLLPDELDFDEADFDDLVLDDFVPLLRQ
jgi:hypothetical protein